MKSDQSAFTSELHNSSRKNSDLLTYLRIPDDWFFIRLSQDHKNIIKKSEGMACRMVHGGQLTDTFQVRTGVRQGCLMSPFLFLLAIDWIMRTSTEGRRNGIQWSLWGQLDDLDFADDLALLSHAQQQMQDKTDTVSYNSTRIGLYIHPTKTNVLKINAINTNQVNKHKPNHIGR